jgi:hypothetical protein
VVTTLLALKILAEVYKAKKEEWAMIDKKARAFVRQQVGTTSAGIDKMLKEMQI